MAKKVYFVHGWGDGLDEVSWLPWLRSECESRGIKLVAFEMPHSDEPKIDEWVGFLQEHIKELDEETFFVGHSIGCQAILRYLEDLPEDKKVGGCVFVAGWFNLLDSAYEEKGEKDIAKPWIESSIDFEKVKTHTNNFVGIFSDDDDCVPLSDAELFKKRLGAKIIVKNNEGHFDDSKKIEEIMGGLEKVMAIDYMQKEVDKMIQKYGGYWKPLSMMARITEEVGELARAMNIKHGDKRSKGDGDGRDIEKELADVLFTTLAIANAEDVNLEKVFMEKLGLDYEKMKGVYDDNTDS